MIILFLVVEQRLILNHQLKLTPNGTVSDSRAEEVKALVEHILFKSPIQPLKKTIKKQIMAKLYGFATTEIVTRAGSFRGRTIETIKEFRPIEQQTVEQFVRNKDKDIIGLIHKVDYDQEEFIPKWKFLYNVENTDTDSPFGEGLMRDLTADGLQYLKLKKMYMTALAFDAAGITIGDAPYTQLIEDGVQKDDRKKRIDPLWKFLTGVKKGDIQATMILDSIPYMTEDEAQRPIGLRQYDIRRVKGDSAGLVNLENALDRYEKNIARVVNSEDQFLGDSGTGNRNLEEGKSLNRYLMVDDELSTVARIIDRDFFPLIAFLNNIPIDLMPTIEFESVQSQDLTEVNKAYELIGKNYDKIDFDDPIQTDFRNRFGFPAMPEKLISDIRNRQEQMRQEFQNQNNQDSEDE